MFYLVLFCKLLITNGCGIVFGRQGPEVHKMREHFGRRQIGRTADLDREAARRARRTKRRVNAPFRVRIAPGRSESNLLTPTNRFDELVRTHLSLYKDSPNPRPVQFSNQGQIDELELVGGLHHHYMRKAA